MNKLMRQWDTWIQEAQERNDLQLLTVQRTWPMGVIRWLTVDQVDKARETLSEGVMQWPSQGFDIHPFWAGMSQSLLHLYAGDYFQAFGALQDLSKRFSRSLLRWNQVLRVIQGHWLAHAALALASITQDRRHLLKMARQQADRLARENYPLAEPYVPYFRGYLSYLAGDEEKAVTLLRESATRFDAMQFKLFAAAANRQLGRLLGGDEGRALMAQADEAMKAEGVVRPERFAAMLLPPLPE